MDDQAALSERLAALELSNAETRTLLEAILDRLPTLSHAAPTPAAPAPVVSPATNTTNIQQTSGLRPNPPPVFDGDRSKGRAFLQAVRAHADLVPHWFLDSAGTPDELKLVRFAMTYMTTGSAGLWVEQIRARSTFPFQDWADFSADFSERFIEENAQENALRKLNSRSYYQGSSTVQVYADAFELLFDTAGITDPLAKVSMFRAGLDIAVDNAIVTSGTMPDI